MLLGLPGMALTITDMSYMTTTSVNTSTDSYDGHKLQCTKEEQHKTACLNGKCYAVDLNSRKSACECDSGWSGDRCETKYLPPEWWEASLLTGLVVVLIVAVIVFAAALGFYFWKKRRGTHDIRNLENGVCLDEVADEVAETPFYSDEPKE